MLKEYMKYRMRHGGLFRKMCQELAVTEKFTLEHMRAYQTKKMQEVLRMAYKGVPFYRKVFKERGMTPDHFTCLEDLEKLPVIDKDTVRLHFKELRNRYFTGATFKGVSSGTSGTPGVFLRDFDAINFENAMVWRYYNWHGRNLEDPCVTLRGDLLFPSDRSKPPYWRRNRVTKELMMSSYHISDKTMPEYIEAIKEYGMSVLFAYPSTAYLLAEFCRRKFLDLKFNSVFVSSEKLHGYQREMIEHAFGCKVYDLYGNAERTASLVECEYGHMHENPEYSIHEYLPTGDGRYELVGTPLHTTVMPLLRYRTGDVVELPEGDVSCACGRPSRWVKTIFGRESNYLLSPEGHKITIFNHIPRDVNHLVEMQLIQEEIDQITVLVVITSDFTKQDLETLKERLYKYISPRTQFTIEHVDKINRTEAGKYQMVIQKLDRS